MPPDEHSNSVEVLDPIDQLKLTTIVEQAAVAAGLSESQQRLLSWRIRYEQGRLILRLFKVEAQASLAEAVVHAEGRVARARERAATAVLAEQLRCLNLAGEALEDALHDSTRLSEDVRGLVQSTIWAVGQRHTKRVEKRAGRP